MATWTRKTVPWSARHWLGRAPNSQSWASSYLYKDHESLRLDLSHWRAQPKDGHYVGNGHCQQAASMLSPCSTRRPCGSFFFLTKTPYHVEISGEELTRHVSQELWRWTSSGKGWTGQRVLALTKLRQTRPDVDNLVSYTYPNASVQALEHC